MVSLDLSYIDELRSLEVEAIDAGCGTSEFTFSPRPANLTGVVSEGEEDAVHGRAVDDVLEIGERLQHLPRYVEIAKTAFDQRDLQYPFEIDASGNALSVLPGAKAFA